MSRRDHMPSRGPSQRQLRVGELIRRTLSDVLMRGDLHDPELEGVSITVGEVQPSPDLRQARVHVMPLGGGDLEAPSSSGSCRSPRISTSESVR
ncbi:MAG: ribosome-binding factor A, partial [Pseudomonadota bacterium]